MQGPAIDQLDEEIPGDKVTFTKVDVDETQKQLVHLAHEYPNIAYQKDGKSLIKSLATMLKNT